MTVQLTDQEQNHLLGFIGYGTLNADVWFLGMEEAGGGEDNLRNRLTFKSVEDCAEAHKILGIEKHHLGKRIIQRTWRGMCCIMLGLEGKEITADSIRKYQADSLGRSGGNTLLVELMPIPKPALDHWGYEKILPHYSSAEAYYSQVKPKRIQYLKGLLEKHQPKVVIGYGKGYWPGYKELFREVSFIPVDQFEVSTESSTLVILTDHFTARTMNNKFDKVVSIIKEIGFSSFPKNTRK